MKAFVVAFAALAFAGSAGAALREARSLEPAASFVAKKPVMVWCSPLTSKTGEHGLATAGDTALFLDKPACDALLAGLAPRSSVYLPTLASVIAILVHEAIHLRGETDEGVTECAAMHETPGVAVRFFHIKPGKQLRALMAGAWEGYRVEPAVYRSVCG